MRFSQWMHDHPRIELAALAVQAAAARISFDVGQVIEHSPLGDKLSSINEQLFS